MLRRVAVGMLGSLAMLFAWGCGDDPDAGEEPFVPTSLELVADSDFKVGGTFRLQTVAWDDAGRSEELTSGVTYASSDENVATVDEEGNVTLVAGGPLTLTATYGELEAHLEARPDCDYPESQDTLRYGNVLPRLRMPAAWPSGERFILDLHEVRCDARWKSVETLHFVLSAGWCKPCTAYARALEHQAATLQRKGMQIVIVELQDVAGAPADVDFAYEHLGKITRHIPGIAVGDKGMFPDLFFTKSRYVEAFPSLFVVRTRDMRMIVDGTTDAWGKWAKSPGMRLPLAEIAEDPDANWSVPPETL